MRAKVYKTGGNSPWEDTFNGLVQGPFAFLLLIEHKFVGGGGRKRGINGLKTPLNHKRAHIRCKARKLYLSSLQQIPTWHKKDPIFGILWSISSDHLNQAEVSRYKLQ